MSNPVTEKLKNVLADTYALYLKSQNYHWHVKGMHFDQLHAHFEGLYTDLATAVDTIAERIIILGDNAPATFGELSKLTSIKDGDSSLKAEAMINDLHDDQGRMLASLSAALNAAQDSGDEGTIAMIGERIMVHEKAAWMLRSLVG